MFTYKLPFRDRGFNFYTDALQKVIFRNNHIDILQKVQEQGEDLNETLEEDSNTTTPVGMRTAATKPDPRQTRQGAKLEIQVSLKCFDSQGNVVVTDHNALHSIAFKRETYTILVKSWSKTVEKDGDYIET